MLNTLPVCVCACMLAHMYRMTSDGSKVEIAGVGGVSLVAKGGDITLNSADNVHIQSTEGSVSTVLSMVCSPNIYCTENS